MAAKGFQNLFAAAWQAFKKIVLIKKTILYFVYIFTQSEKFNCKIKCKFKLLFSKIQMPTVCMDDCDWLYALAAN